MLTFTIIYILSCLLMACVVSSLFILPSSGSKHVVLQCQLLSVATKRESDTRETGDKRREYHNIKIILLIHLLMYVGDDSF
jgi:hypothetical protein